MKRTIFTTVVGILLATLAAHAELLDGTKWKVDVTPAREAAAKGVTAFADELVFDSGKFRAIAALAKGFKPAPYSADDEGYEIEFESVLTSDSEGRATWAGGVENGALTGKLEYIKKDGAKVYFTFKGVRE